MELVLFVLIQSVFGIMPSLTLLSKIGAEAPSEEEHGFGRPFLPRHDMIEPFAGVLDLLQADVAEGNAEVEVGHESFVGLCRKNVQCLFRKRKSLDFAHFNKMLFNATSSENQQITPNII